MTDDNERETDLPQKDADKLAQADFPSGLIPREDGEPELTTEQSRAKTKQPEHGGD